MILGLLSDKPNSKKENNCLQKATKIKPTLEQH